MLNIAKNDLFILAGKTKLKNISRKKVRSTPLNSTRWRGSGFEPPVKNFSRVFLEEFRSWRVRR
jgi:hypothetical protein